ncbi:MAG: hypothetical protein LBI10_10525, partial [Deltaproteobacteria bacterium]|nr:hypothetical protein [Deltaproteobacteria bacterium]
MAKMKDLINKALKLHQLWVTSKGEQGERLVFDGLDLSRASFKLAKLEAVDLSGAYLAFADLN